MRRKPTSSRKLVVLDLDETLIFGTRNMLDRPPDFVVSPYQIYKRPHLDIFLDYCFSEFLVGVWTSSSPQYATLVTEGIFKSEDPPVLHELGPLLPVLRRVVMLALLDVLLYPVGAEYDDLDLLGVGREL